MKLSNKNICPFEKCPGLGIDEWLEVDLEHARSYYMYKYDPKAGYSSYIHLDGRFYESYLRSLAKYANSLQKKNTLSIPGQNKSSS